MDYYKIGQKMRKIPKAHGLSQNELAEKVNISTNHMSHIETGNTQLSLPVFVDIAAAITVYNKNPQNRTLKKIAELNLAAARKIEASIAAKNASDLLTPLLIRGVCHV